MFYAGSVHFLCSEIIQGDELMSDKTQKRITFGYNRGLVNQIEINKAQAITVNLLFEYYAEN
jgi:hypothetical protein